MLCCSRFFIYRIFVSTRHARSYHQKKPRPDEVSGGGGTKSAPSTKSNGNNSSRSQRLCENCGKTVSLSTMARHKSECRSKKTSLHDANCEESAMESSSKIFGDDEGDGEGGGLIANGRSKKYIPEKLTGICPYCEYKFADLLGHVRHNHDKEKQDKTLATSCSLCQETFNSGRELITHRQKHPKFKHHACTKCNLAEFDTVVELRYHRKEECVKRKKKKIPVKSSSSSSQAPMSDMAGPSSGSKVLLKRMSGSSCSFVMTPLSIAGGHFVFQSVGSNFGHRGSFDGAE